MNYIFFGSAAVSFIISYFIGKKIKKFWSLFAVPLVVVLVSAPSLWLCLRFGDLERFGLGVIAIVPILIIFISFFTLVPSFLGVLIGVLYAKRKNQA